MIKVSNLKFASTKLAIYIPAPMKKLLTPLLVYLFLVPFLFSPASPTHAAPAPTPQTLPEELAGLSTYPKDIRQAILQVCLDPKLLKEVLSLQGRAIAEFKKLLVPYPRILQEQLYQVARFPKLINDLTAGGKKSEKTYKSLVASYPKEIRKAALGLAKNQFDLLAKIDALNGKFNREFEDLVQGQPPETRSAFLTVLQHPEILLILSRHPEMANEVATAYKKNPVEAQKKARKIFARVKQGNAKTLKNWPNKTEQHLQALAALEKSETAFTQESDEEFHEILDPAKAVQANVNFNPYFYPYLGAYGVGLYNFPYWFGFPGWGFDGWD